MHEKRPLGRSSGAKIILTWVGVALGDSPYLSSDASFPGDVADFAGTDRMLVKAQNHCFQTCLPRCEIVSHLCKVVLWQTEHRTSPRTMPFLFGVLV